MSEKKKKDWQKVMADAEKKQDKAGKKEQPKLAPKEKFSVLEHPEYKELAEKLTATEQQVTEHWNEILRTKAEMENVRRRAERDVTNAHKYGLEKFIPELLPVIDSLERGFESCDPSDEISTNMHHGMQLTLEMFLKTLTKFGIEQVDPIGKDFDPDLHEAMSMKEDPHVKPNTVVAVLQKGYQLNDRLIRPALVVVSRGV